MKLSARNQLNGKVKNVEIGAVMASIKIEVENPNTVTALITKESALNLGLKEGDDVAAIIKSTEIIVGKEMDDVPEHPGNPTIKSSRIVVQTRE